jgi:hypothetical protein
VIVADSELINEFLDTHTNGQVYAGLTESQKAHGFALARLTEDHLYWLMVASRWLDDQWWPNIVKGFFGYLPGVVRPLATRIARRSVRKTYDLHGLGRHSLEEQRGFAERDLRALSASVPENDFLFGQPESWITPIARGFPRLQAYTERVQESVGVFGRHL